MSDPKFKVGDAVVKAGDINQWIVMSYTKYYNKYIYTIGYDDLHTGPCVIYAAEDQLLPASIGISSGAITNLYTNSGKPIPIPSVNLTEMEPTTDYWGWVAPEQGCVHEEAIYDSGFSRVKYCKKCNQDLGKCE